MLSENIKINIKKQALENPTIECCGVIVNGETVPLINNSTHPSNHFQFQLQQSIDAIYHSHQKGENFSNEDYYIAELLQKPIITYNIEKDDFEVYEPCGFRLPLMGRSYLPGTIDCISLICDYYKYKTNINIPLFWHSARIEDFSLYPTHQQEFITYLIQNGFSESKKIKKHSLLLILNRQKYPFELGIVMENNNIICYNKERTKAVDLDAFLLNRPTVILNHYLL